MIYTNNNKLLMTVTELTAVLDCSYTYLNTIIGRFDFPRVKYKDRGKFIEVNKNFCYKMCDFLRVIDNKKAHKVIKKIEELEIS